ncbi:MAG: hypothetical protein IT314_08410 [Anaerolineales bacterium]|nr:hypothetical protein [Anaerolineales bacterium]
MLEFYYRLWIAGAYALTAVLILSQATSLITFFLIGWGILRTKARIHEMFLVLNTCLATLTLIAAVGQTDLPLSQSEKALLSLSSAQVAAALVGFISGYIGQLEQPNWKWVLGISLLLLVFFIVIGTIVCVPALAIIYSIGVWQIIRNKSQQQTASTDAIARTASSGKDEYQKILKRMTSPKFRFVTDMISLLTFASAYWFFGFRSDWVLFVVPAVLLVFTNRFFSLFLARWRKPDEKAQVRPINPFAFAGSLIILFSFYIALLLKHPDRPLSVYWTSSAIFLIALLYFSNLGRHEATIEVASDAIYSDDYDFQMDATEGSMDLFTKSLWISHPIFLALGLGRAGGVNEGESLMVEAWFSAMIVAIVVSLIYSLTSLAVWARNIRAPRLSVAGVESRPEYPDFRDRLASSALPYCILIPALVYALSNLLEFTPSTLLGFKANLWLDIAIYASIAVFLFGIFVQLPYRSGAKAWKSPKLEALEAQVKILDKEIRERREQFAKSKTSAVIMKNIADELTLYRLRSEIQESKTKKLGYTISWTSELEGASALVYLANFLVTAISAVIASNLEKIINFVLKIPT